MADAYLGSRETKELAQGGMVKVQIGGEYHWISGTDVTNRLG